MKGNIVEGRGSPNNEGYTTSPNLILQQMAKCNLWPWQIAVLVKPSSSIREKWEKQTDEVERSWNGGAGIQRWEREKYLRGEKLKSWVEQKHMHEKEKGTPDGEEESHELNLTDLRKINNQNFSRSNRSERELRRERCQKTKKGQLRATSEWRRAVRGEMRRQAGKQLKAGW